MAITYDVRADAYQKADAGWGDALSVVVPASGDYLVFMGCAVRKTDANGNDVEFQLIHESTQLSFGKTSYQHPYPFGTICKITAVEDDTVKVQAQPSLVWGDSADVNTGSALAIMPMPTGTQFQSNTTETDYNTDTEWQNFATLTFTPASEQDYILAGSLSMQANNGDNQISWRIYNHTDSQEIGLYQRILAAGEFNRYQALTALKRVTLTAQEKTFYLQYKTTGTDTTVTVDQGFLTAIPVSGVSNIRSAYSASGSGGTNNNWHDAVTDTWTPVADLTYLQFYNISHGLFNEGIFNWEYAKAQARKDGTAFAALDGQWHTGNPQDHYRPYLAINPAVLGAVERTDDIQYGRDEGGEGAYIDASIISFTEGEAITDDLIAISSTNSGPFSFYSKDGAGDAPITRSVELTQDSTPTHIESAALTAYLISQTNADQVKISAIDEPAGVTWQFSKNNSDWFTELTYDNITGSSGTPDVETIYIRTRVINDGSVTTNTTAASIKIEGWGVST